VRELLYLRNMRKSSILFGYFYCYTYIRSIDRFKSKLECGRIIAKSEVVVFIVFKFRICNC